MKNLVLVLMTCAVALTACSSKKKKDEAAQPPVIEQKATTSKSIEKIEKKKAKKEKAAAAAAAATATQPVADSAPAETTAPATTSSGGSFDSFTGTEKSSHSCVSKGDTRKITVLSGANGGCGVVYNKMGEDKTVAVAKADLNHCDTVANKIKSNLETAGYDCGGGTAQPAKAAAPSANEPAVQPTN